MNPASDSRSGGRDEVDTNNKRTTPNASPGTTPATDMQPEDAGTAASGNERRGTAAESAMKQEHKTQEESGSGR